MELAVGSRFVRGRKLDQLCKKKMEVGSHIVERWELGVCSLQIFFPCDNKLSILKKHWNRPGPHFVSVVFKKNVDD